ncbi:hypothetical protein DRW41_08235 [Neobacillus piezotolerans]|uniref:Uncharacterized protein n=1 Tax=Neobacillus piezotolerans TaxID=2259171 RepID=A0A3D8GUB7_9BACI|nr:hypothetical protein [Neobacillus piezotolerans]RDU37799.1 hypothetical protein DRW41_08235 [Neobacillus piezotolerans]
MPRIEMFMKVLQYLTIPFVIAVLIFIFLILRAIFAILIPRKTRLVQCTNCIELIDETALTCKYCKTVINRPEKKPNIFIRMVNYKTFDNRHDRFQAMIKDFHRKNNDPRV